MSLQRKRRSRIWSIPSDEFAGIVKSATTLTTILKQCGLQNIGGNFHTVLKRIQEDGLDLSHIPRGLDSNRGRVITRCDKPSLDSILVEESNYGRTRLKKRLIKEGILENKCARCNKPPVWEGEPLVLRLDHINGVNNDNRLDNLRLVCPNCDSQLPTFSGRNHAKWFCRDCSKKCSSGSARCQRCANHLSANSKSRIEWPPLEELQARVAISSLVAVGRELGVSDVAVRKHLNRAK